MYVLIKKGVYRTQLVKGIYKVYKPHNGKHVIIDIPEFQGIFTHTLQPRIICKEEDFFYCDAEGNELNDHQVSTNSAALVTPNVQPKLQQEVSHYETELLSAETEEEAVARIGHSFEMLDRISENVCKGIIRGLIISGPPGVGKSYGVEEILRKNNMFLELQGQPPFYEIVNGTGSAVNLYMKLWGSREPGNVLMLDDSDPILFDEECLSLLKSVLDSKPVRRVSYLKESKVLSSEDIPKTFEFRGSVIFLTNVNFETFRESRIKQHIEALLSRCHYFDVAIYTNRDKILRIKHAVREGMFKKYEFRNGEENIIIKYIEDNQDYLREISLRMGIKIAELVKALPGKWHDEVEATCLKREARFKRMLEERQKKQALPEPV